MFQVKGKVAIDVVCNTLGKLGGALVQQSFSFGSLATSTPYAIYTQPIFLFTSSLLFLSSHLHLLCNNYYKYE